MLEYRKPSSITKKPNETRDFLQCLCAMFALMLLVFLMPGDW